MTPSPIETILKVCDDLEAARAKATQGEWQQGGCSGRMILEEGVTNAFSGGDIADVDTKANSDFILLAANRILALTKALRDLASKVETVNSWLAAAKCQGCDPEVNYFCAVCSAHTEFNHILFNVAETLTSGGEG